MLLEFSFDVVSEFDAIELTNALDQARREVGTRYDFKDTFTAYDHSGQTIQIESASEDRAEAAALQVLREKAAARRQPSPKLFKAGDPKTIGKGRGQIEVQLNAGITDDIARDLRKRIQNATPKVQVRIQGDQLARRQQGQGQPAARDQNVARSRGHPRASAVHEFTGKPRSDPLPVWFTIGTVLVIPAIDILGGKCVRLKRVVTTRRRPSTRTTRSTSCPNFSDAGWQSASIWSISTCAARGSGDNHALIQSIVHRTDLEVQVARRQSAPRRTSTGCWRLGRTWS